MESQPAVNELLAYGKAAISAGDKAAAADHLHEATKVNKTRPSRQRNRLVTYNSYRASTLTRLNLVVHKSKCRRGCTIVGNPDAVILYV